MPSIDRVKWAYRLIGSKEMAAFLFLAFCLVLIPGTFTKGPDAITKSLRIGGIGLVGISLVSCTMRRAKTLPASVFVIHLGVILLLAGCAVSAFGYVATVNVYEGTSVDRAYRWDTMDDALLDMELGVKKIHTEYYPIPLKIGVLRGKEKVGLFEIKTGGNFKVGGYLVCVDSMEFPVKKAVMRVFNEGNFLGSADTSGAVKPYPDFPYTFVLVAYKDPDIKRMWLDLMLSKNGGPTVQGTSEVNRPFKWDGLGFYLTRTDIDQYGSRFAGVQITRDPGRPFVFSGFAVMGIGSLAYLAGRFRVNG